MKIVINPFDPKSISEAQEALRNYPKDFETKLDEFTRRLAEIGVAVAEIDYATSVDNYESSGITVSLQDNGDGYSVLAKGEIVGFLEFGTGIRNREWDNTGMEYTPPAHGTYGKGQGKNPWGWWFYPNEGAAAQHTYGEPPVEAMRWARDQMIENVARIAREVWR